MGEIFERAVPRDPLEWTGERLTTATAGQVEIEHLHRYFLARDLCRDRDVLDVASGEGYGSALLAQVAHSVVGIELSEQAVLHASIAYSAANLRYQQGDARNLPLDNSSVDVVVSFETIEHFFEHERFVAEVRRVLRPGGQLIISSPEPSAYSPTGSPANPFHVRELSRTEFEALLRASFNHLHVLVQRPILGSALIADQGDGALETLTFERRGSNHYEANRGLPRSPYIIAIASDEPVSAVPNSLFIETSEIGQVLACAALGARQEELHSEVEAQSRRAREAEVALAAVQEELHVQVEAQAKSAKEAEATLAAMQEELQRPTDTTIASSEAYLRLERESDQLRLGIEHARAELLAVCRQRDLIRTAFSRRAAAITELRSTVVASQREVAELRSTVVVSQREVAELRGTVVALRIDAENWQRRYSVLRARVVALQKKAANWQRRYGGLRARLEAIMRRLGVLHASRLVPRPIRRLVRERVLGPGKPR